VAEFQDQVALITGSTRGIGLAIAKELASAGAHVVINSRNAEACESVARVLRGDGCRSLAVPCNVSRSVDLEHLVKVTLAEFGRIDVLVCNAAANPAYGPSQDMSNDVFDKIIDTNVRSAFGLCKLVLPQMAQRRSGAVVLMSSVTALAGNCNIGLYGMSKAAIIQMTRNLAVEWGSHNVRVNCIAPGLVKTDFAKALWDNPELRARIENRTPLGRIGEPEDIARVVRFLASDAAGFVTGQVLVADGGLMISDPL
jgi:NAD(P)-dependent dehydrogenase (short-subunit alcohol dehydrogenase family)